MAIPATDAEAKTLLRYLDHQRIHALGILEGLDEQELRRPILPSGWSCLGMIRHLTRDIERFWFRAVVAGDQETIDELARDQTGAWQVPDDESSSVLFDRYRLQSEFSDAIIAATPLDAAPAWWPEGLFGDWRLETVREIVLHVLTETATHTGHLDAARELIDGRTWLVLE